MERRFFGRKNENAGMIDETGNPGYSPAFFSRILRKHSRFEFVYRSMLRFRELAPLPLYVAKPHTGSALARS